MLPPRSAHTPLREAGGRIRHHEDVAGHRTVGGERFKDGTGVRIQHKDAVALQVGVAGSRAGVRIRVLAVVVAAAHDQHGLDDGVGRVGRAPQIVSGRLQHYRDDHV